MITVIDGPFAESKEVVGGFATLEVKSKEDAREGCLAVAAQAAKADKIRSRPGKRPPIRIAVISPAVGGPMRRESIAILSGVIVFIAACAAQPTSQPPAAAGTATLSEGARLITGDEVPPIENSAFVVQDGKFTVVEGDPSDLSMRRFAR